jgi:UDPglucose--hexose-1-phosphate uridylyltransferase
VHNRFPAIRDASEMAPLIMAYQERYNTLMAHPSTEYVLIFKNHGEEAGTSIEHPHSQIIASPVVPESAWRRGDIARGHYRRTGRCLHCQMADEELQLGSRIVYRDGRFVVFHPFAAARCAETWIIPLDHQPSFGEAGADELAHFASVLGQTLRQLSAAFGDPDYNYALHSAPKGEESKPYQHWHLQLIPRLTKAAGFELGSGIYINTSPPEQTAEAMRRAPV